MVSYLCTPQNKFLRFRMLQSLNCSYKFNSFILGLNVWQHVAQVHYIDQLHECCLPKQFFHFIKMQACHPSVPFHTKSYLHMSVWPWKITAMRGGIDSVYTFLSLSTIVPPTLFYVNQPTVTVSTVSYHHQHLCELNNYMTGGFSSLDLHP